MKVENEKVYSFSECLYKANCCVCGDELTWEAEFDADGTDYMADCCGKVYHMSPHTVKVTISKIEE
jgi:hypothetical protein